MGDVISVTIYGLSGPGAGEPMLLRVDEEGNVSLPYVKKVKLSEMTTDRAAQVVSEAMKKGRVMPDAIVAIGIARTAAESQTKPGPIAIGDKLQITVFDLVAQGQRCTLYAQVAEDGTVVLPFAGAIKISDVSEADANEVISKQMEAKQVIQGAVVSVLRLEPDGRP